MRANEVLKVLNITRPTLCKYIKEGKIKIDATINGQYRYNAESVFHLIGKEVPDKYKNI
jgi:predicted site-specific integrase-resolvase